MSELKKRIQTAMTDAMKAKASERLTTIRLAFNAIRKKEIDTRQDLNDAEIEKTLLTMMKQSNETLEQVKKLGKAEAIAEVEREIAVLKEFLPQQMSEAEVDKTVAAIVQKLKGENKLPQGGAAMGMIMKEVMAQIGGKSEGRVIQAAVKKALA